MFEEIELFQGLSSSELATLEMFCQQRTYEAGDIIFSEGQEATAMYVLKSGLLEAYTHEKILGQILPGNIFGEMAIFAAHKTRTAGVKVLEKSEVITLLSFSVTELGNKHPQIHAKIKEIIELRAKQNEGK